MLQGAFRRTWRVTGLEIDLLSAYRRHQDLLPRETALHLFSSHLPFRGLAAAWLAEQKMTTSAPLVERLAAWSEEAAIVALSSWTGSGSTGEAVGNGLLLGTLSPTELDAPEILHSVSRQLAGAYTQQGADLRVPYFDLTR